MKNQPIRAIQHVVAIVILSNLTACGWVDSTGLQSETMPGNTLSNAGLRNAQPLAVLEEIPLTAELVGEGSALTKWTWVADSTDARQRCDTINGFDAQLAAASLEKACSNPQSCEVSIDESYNDSGTRFTLLLPALRSPVALTYVLSTIRDDGAKVMRQQLICGVSINEAPITEDDRYIALRSTLRIVNAEDSDNLLSNDSDDNDVRNQSLRVLTDPVDPPKYASQFSLDSNGGFIYQASEQALRDNSGITTDSFTYLITDGLHTVQATATINIVNSNSSPKRIKAIPDFQISVDGSQSSKADRVVDLTEYFTDPDGNPLHFWIDETVLPSSGNLTVSPAGLLTLGASSQDAGRWNLRVMASDGLASTSDLFRVTITIDETPDPVRPNQPPTATDIRNRIVQNTFSYNVSSFFADEDGDTLSYSATGLPRGISISNEGVIRGTASSVNRGSWLVKVSASDGIGGTATDGFLLVIN